VLRTPFDEDRPSNGRGSQVEVSEHERGDAAQDLGVRAIVIYKTVKGAVQLALALALLVLLPLGLAPWLHEVAQRYRDHATRAWGVWFAEVLLRNASVGRVVLAAVALGLDGALTSVEGWALRRGHTWGEWLVVVASGTLLPIEAYALWTKRHWPHLAGFLLNLLIVVYLAWQAVGRGRRAKAAG